MKVFNSVLTDDIKEILNLQAKIKLEENKYASLLEEDQPLEVLKEIRLKIRYLKDKLMILEEHAIALFN